MSHGFAQELYRARTGPAQDLYRPCTAPMHGPHGSCTVPVPNLCCHDMSYVRNLHGHPYGPCTGPVRGVYGPVQSCTFLNRGYCPLSVKWISCELIHGSPSSYKAFL